MIPGLDRAVIDLGKDHERMSEQDACRQHATVARILERFFGPGDRRLEVQLLADEVGLGKTFVALATAYTILTVFRRRDGEEQLPDLKDCYRAALVVTPAGNHALTAKWHLEVEALRTRCSRDPSATHWFQARVCATPEELVESLRRAHDLRRDPEKAPCVLVCQANVFTRRLRDAGERLRFIAASLFRWWGNKLSNEERYQIVRRAAEVRGFSHWAERARWMSKGEYEVGLWDFREQEEYLAEPERRRQEGWYGWAQKVYDQTPFSYDEMAEALDRLARTEEGEALLYDERLRTRDGWDEPRGLLPYCKWVADRRGHADWYFHGFKDRLADLYRELCPFLMRRDLPLVVADEAHHWRHSQRQDCQAFRRFIAPFTRRLLLLTATPFQLHRDEILEVLATADSMEPAVGTQRVQALRSLRDGLAEAMRASEEAGRAFSQEWGRLANQFVRLDGNSQVVISRLPGEEDPRTQEISRYWESLRSLSGGERNLAFAQPGPDLRHPNRGRPHGRSGVGCAVAGPGQGRGGRRGPIRAATEANVRRFESEPIRGNCMRRSSVTAHCSRSTISPHHRRAM